MTGRPSKFKPELCRQAERLARLGATDKEIADFFEVTEATITNWKKRHPEFMEALTAGKQISDDQVELSLYRRAMGYTHPEEKVFCNNGVIVRADTVKHHPPDTTACIFWLKNRRPDDWRDVKGVEHSGTLKHQHSVEELTDDELERIAAGGSAGTAKKAKSKRKSASVH